LQTTTPLFGQKEEIQDFRIDPGFSTAPRVDRMSGTLVHGNLKSQNRHGFFVIFKGPTESAEDS
jgi:hypothetical protein